jgi:transcriptional regulator NrdR family protein
MYAVETRSTPKKIIRIRQCRHCGRRLKTYEQIAGYAAAFNNSATDQV